MNQILNIWLEASIQAHGFIGKEFWTSRVDDMRKVYLPAAENWVAEAEGSIRGFVSLHGESLAALFVAPFFQGQGAGKLLVDKAKSRRNRLTLSVYKENRKAVAFYQQCGFKVIKEQMDRHTQHLEVVMSFSAE